MRGDRSVVSVSTKVIAARGIERDEYDVSRPSGLLGAATCAENSKGGDSPSDLRENEKHDRMANLDVRIGRRVAQA
jgi:hypothetical protein